jgi:ribosomal-protein-alanine N-acetyltransferase
MLNSKFPILNLDSNFYLRDFKKQDAKNYFKIYTEPSIAQFLPDSLIPRTLEEAEFEINAIEQSFLSGSSIYWAIVERETEKVIGGCGFHDWHKFNNRIEIAYEMHPEYHRKGIMLKSIKQIMKFAFLQMRVMRVQATTVEENDASKSLLLKFGFKFEGTLYKYKFFKDKMIDVLMFSYNFEDFMRDIESGRY